MTALDIDPGTQRTSWNRKTNYFCLTQIQSNDKINYNLLEIKIISEIYQQTISMSIPTEVMADDGTVIKDTETVLNKGKTVFLIY